ncbi:dimethylaniline monooxygenase [N-oxide-forming] 3-like [Photinus pyralis]|uniref:dimethylaniline monooxygenase [N-oxide-forming] 3-like n=1 Tax=Photinus pyralis TaxID=7054 RepID=UPI0012670274|nr:dimethylaniline monooxygenase [N-oxide-forming] 3-like [Photinus pyralis]XP_031351271.1 dimethylaniline monooxygenase [N-oxide-forming] 3-like [Photinus pyralis]
MKIVIIGAGIAGVVTLKYALNAGHECDVFEQTGELGGTWVYSDQTDMDEFGFPSHRTMYKGLITNLPKEVMEFHNFRYPSAVEKSFLTQPEVLHYVQSYAYQYNLHNKVKYYKRVTKVAPVGTQWSLTVLDLKTKVETSLRYDAVFVCNGHFFHPHIPNIEGQDIFKGSQLHSRDYRTPEKFKNKRVLIIGGSYSGSDIASHILSSARSVKMSHHSPITIRLADGVTTKPAVVKLNENQVMFSDDSDEEVDVILYCTGYKYFYPFLTEECGIKVEDNWVRNLYKHIVNVERPTLLFIGIPFLTCAFPTCDIQARFALATLEKKVALPSKEEMVKELNEHVNNLRRHNIPQRHIHKIGSYFGEYLNDLAKLAKIEPLPPAVIKLYKHFIEDKPIREATRKYVLVDNENYKEELLC